MKDTYYATVTTKGQITVPKAVREALAVYSGDRIAFTLEDGQIGVVGVSSSIEDLIGSIKPVPGAGAPDWDEVRQDAWDQVVEDRTRRMSEQ